MDKDSWIWSTTFRDNEISEYPIYFMLLSKKNKRDTNALARIFRPAVIIVSIISIILIQPDLGSSAVIFISVLGILFVAGVKIQQFLVVALLGVIAITMMIIFVPWRWERIISFIDPWSDPWGSGYQLTLSLMSIGRGIGLELDWDKV